MNRERIQKVIDAVKAHPDAQFNMDFWDCGTTQCAIGAFCVQNPDAELTLKRSVMTPMLCYPIFHVYSGLEAVSEYLAISGSDTDRLFYKQNDNDNDSKSKVIERLEAFMAR